jgi:hypothetical protein
MAQWSGRSSGKRVKRALLIYIAGSQALVVCTSNPNTWGAEELEASLGYIVTPCHKKKKKKTVFY